MMRQIASEAPETGQTYVYRGFVVNWHFGRLSCLRPGESEITPEMRDFFVEVVSPSFHENSHTMLDGRETKCLVYKLPMSQTEVMALIDRFWSEAMSGGQIKAHPDSTPAQNARAGPR